MGWTDERVEQLKALWTEGLSASQIARVLGGVTRNAVIGKVHRLGLAGRAGPARSERPRSAVTRRSVAHVVAPPPEIIEEDPERPDVPLADWRSGGKRIPFLRPQAEIRLALLRSSRPQGLSAAASTPGPPRGGLIWRRTQIARRTKLVRRVCFADPLDCKGLVERIAG